MGFARGEKGRQTVGQTARSTPPSRNYYPLNDQPLRIYGFKYLFASALFVIRILIGSYSTLPSTRSAITPSSIHSTNGAATLKLEHEGSPPLQARIQSR